MKHTPIALSGLLLALATAMSACAKAPDPAIAPEAIAPEAITPEAITPEISAPADPVAATPVDALPLMIVHKSPSCGCCGGWVEHMREAGFTVEVRNADNLNPVKQRVGVPLGKGSCHTAEVGGYFVEGHVPAQDVKRLLAERLDASGLVLPGMPAGSPGMELPDGRTQPYTVELVARDGSTSAFAQHGSPATPAP